MSLLLFGIIASQYSSPIDADLRLIKFEGLTALVKASDAELSRESSAVMAYGDQIMRIHQQTTLIPVRYGSLLADEQEVIKHLTEYSAHYHSLLAKLDDCEEVGIRMTLIDNDNETNAQQASGQAYLLARKHVYSVPELAAQQETLINHTLAGLYREHRASLSLFNGQRTYLLSYLVPRATLMQFKEGYFDLAAGMGANVTLSGPWPPYNFSE
jgi:hypothetical protein|tara:strand:+ start:2408 stop:3046 length:639 start_codon:yes stop_codon:yes gene_type:complete